MLKTPDDLSVISMAVESLARRRGQLDLIHTHWSDLRDGPGLPARSDLEPRSMEDALDVAFLGERLTSTSLRLRIAGSHLNELAGFKITGLPLATLFARGARTELGRTIRNVLDRPAIARLFLTGPKTDDGTQLDGEMILLPMLSDMGDTTRILGGLVAGGRIGTSERRFEIEAVEITPISVNASQPQITPRRVDAPTSKRGLDRPFARAGHLRLVVSNS